jgi:hypothetical protein
MRPAGRFVAGHAGRTKSRFFKADVFPGGVQVICEEGVVPGSPPAGCLVCAQYDFRLFDRRMLYIRVDVTGPSRQNCEGQTDPNNPRYNPDLQPSRPMTSSGCAWVCSGRTLFANNTCSPACIAPRGPT